MDNPIGYRCLAEWIIRLDTDSAPGGASHLPGRITRGLYVAELHGVADFGPGKATATATTSPVAYQEIS